MISELKPYQKEAAKFISESWQVLLADEMGLGKTATALSGIADMVKSERRLVVCPASLKLNWCHEIKTWLGIDVKPDDLYSYPIAVTNYDRLKQYMPDIEHNNFNGVIFDESHYMKKPKSQRTEASIYIGGLWEYKMLISGTPMVSGPADLATQLDCLCLLGLFGGDTKFYRRYCDPVKTRYGWDYSGSSHKKELHDKLSPYMIRRTKKQVGIRLPRKHIIDVPIAECKQEFASTFKDIEKQQKEINAVKFPYVVDFIDNLLEQGKNIVVFAHHRNVQKALLSHYKSIAVSIHGGQDMADRDGAVQSFQNGEKQIIICSLQAASVGVTLTASDTAVFVEYLWSPSVHEQAMDRIHRITQKKPVTVYNLYCPGSIEDQKDICSYVKSLDIDGIL